MNTIKSKSYFVINGKPVDGDGNSLLIEDVISRLDSQIAKLQAEREERLRAFIADNPDDAVEVLEKFGFGDVQFVDFTDKPKSEYEQGLDALREAGVEVKGRPSKEWVKEQLSALEHSQD